MPTLERLGSSCRRLPPSAAALVRAALRAADCTYSVRDLETGRRSPDELRCLCDFDFLVARPAGARERLTLLIFSTFSLILLCSVSATVSALCDTVRCAEFFSFVCVSCVFSCFVLLGS